MAGQPAMTNEKLFVYGRSYAASTSTIFRNPPARVIFSDASLRIARRRRALIEYSVDFNSAGLPHQIRFARFVRRRIRTLTPVQRGERSSCVGAIASHRCRP